MFDLFGAEMPLAVRFFLAFLIVLGLIGVAAWAVRRFGSARLGGTVRGRQPRLAVIDYATVDARRRLILVRRDNIEHLVMIGGPSDVVVEANIVRAAPAGRDMPVARPPVVPEPLPRAIPLPEAGNGNGSWPLQPEPMTPFAPPRRARVEPHTDERQLAEPRRAAPINAEGASAADRSLAEMAQRLEAALRKPKAEAAAGAPAAPAADAEFAPSAPIVTPPPPRARTADAESASSAPTVPQPPARSAADAKPAAAAKVKDSKLYDTLEQEMASLLGRSPGKTG
jgi:flagellar protein FliO/FliZ